jgi:putative flippase GtrA
MSSNVKFNSLKKDLIAASIIGLSAGLLASFVARNLNLNFPAYIIVIGFFILCVTGIFVARFAGKYVPFIYSFGKFGETGGLNWLVDFGVLNLLILLTGVNSGLLYSVFKGGSFIAANTNSYLWNKFWVFEKGSNKKVGSELTKFVVASVAGLVLNVLIATIVRSVGPGLYSLDGTIWANIAAAVGSITAMVFNFLLYKFWVFK